MWANLNNKMKIRKIIPAFMWLLLIMSVAVLLSFVQNKRNGQVCRDVKINFATTDEFHFVDSAVVFDLINRGGVDKVKGKPMQEINVSELEEQIERNPYVRNAEVYSQIEGDLVIEIQQKRPLIRVFSQSGDSYYIDELGYKMPLSDYYTARVLVCNGAINEQYNKIDTIGSKVLKNLYLLAQYVEKNPFWKAQFEQIFVNQEGDFVLIPKLGEQKIVFGGIENYEEKFRRLQLFYKHAITKAGWQKYNTINLNYSGQVICEKNSTQSSTN